MERRIDSWIDRYIHRQDKNKQILIYIDTIIQTNNCRIVLLRMLKQYSFQRGTILKNAKPICPNSRFIMTHLHQKELRLLMCFVMELLGHFGHIFLLLDAPNGMTTSWRAMTYDENSDQQQNTRTHTAKESTTGTTPLYSRGIKHGFSWKRLKSAEQP